MHSGTILLILSSTHPNERRYKKTPFILRLREGRKAICAKHMWLSWYHLHSSLPLDSNLSGYGQSRDCRSTCPITEATGKVYFRWAYTPQRACKPRPYMDGI